MEKASPRGERVGGELVDVARERMGGVDSGGDGRVVGHGSEVWSAVVAREYTRTAISDD